MKILLMTLLLLNIACSPEDKAQIVPLKSFGVNKEEKEINALIQDNEQIQRDMAQGILFQGATTRQVNDFTEFLIQSRRELLKLLDNIKNKKALEKIEQLSESAKKLPIQLKDQTYITPYIKDIDALVERVYIIQGRVPLLIAANYTYSEAALAELIIERDDTAGVVKPRSNDHGDYLSFDARKKNGKVNIISPAFKLENVNYELSLSHLVRFYNDEARSLRLIKVYVGMDKPEVKDIEWRDTEIVIAPDAGGFGDAPSISSVQIEENNQSIRVKVEYGSVFDDSVEPAKEFAPAFNIFKVEIKEVR